MKYNQLPRKGRRKSCVGIVQKRKGFNTVGLKSRRKP